MNIRGTERGMADPDRAGRRPGTRGAREQRCGVAM